MKRCPTCNRPFVDSQEACPLDHARLEPGSGPEPEGLGRVLGSYRLIALLGKGGMGDIYIGAHTRLNRYVAIKLLRKDLQHRKANVARFFEEARTVSRLKHPNIVESLDLVEDVQDGAYCVLELLQGPDLKQRLTRGSLPLASAIHIGAQLADALSAVHAIDIVHRDLKPENLILIHRGGRDDFVKLIDFGVAQIEWEGTSGAPHGTAAYMAPEQAAGERVDGRADIYALGVLLFEMVTGQHPFPSSTDNEYLLRHADDPPPRPSKIEPRVPRDLDALILRCLAKQPAQRFETTAEVAEALRRIDTVQRGNRMKWGVLGGVAAVTAAAALVVPRYLDHDAPTRVPPPPVSIGSPDPAPVEVVPPPQIDAPVEITISFNSSPPGAQVYRASETVPLGTTPFATTFVVSDEAMDVRFELAGHHALTEPVALAASHEVTGLLSPLPQITKRAPPAPLPKPARTKPGLQREGTIDPFDSN